MFLRRCFLSRTSFGALSLPSLRRFSSSGLPRQRDYMANADCRAIPLRNRVAFLIHLPDLDTAAKHARLAPFAEYDYDRNDYHYHYNDADDENAVDWVCGAIIVAMCKAKRYRDALDLIRYFFKEHKMIPPKGSFNHVLIRGVVDDPTNATTTLLWVKRLAQAGSFDEAMKPFINKVLISWTDPFGMYLDVTNSLIRGLLDLGDFKEAHKLFGQIKRRDDDPLAEIKASDDHNRRAVAVATFMEYWFKQGKEKEAMECYDYLLAMVPEDIESTGAIAILQVLLKYDKKTQAWAFYHQLVDMDLEFLDSRLLNPTMVNECFKMGRFYDAILTFKLHSRNTGPGFGNIITRFCELGLLYEAEHFFAELQRDYDENPDVSTYRALMDGYVKAGRLDDVLRISNHMVDAYLKHISRLSGLSFPDTERGPYAWW